jgi:hypothetical protein
MIALSIRQPWAWLIVHGYKDVENRTWPTRRRGPFLVHAGKTLDHEGYEFVEAEWSHIWMPAPKDLELGGIVGRATLTDCVHIHPSPWFSGPCGFVLADAEPLPFQPCRGMLGFFTPETTESP